jgi:hypothetical protein
VNLETNIAACEEFSKEDEFTLRSVLAREVFPKVSGPSLTEQEGAEFRLRLNKAQQHRSECRVCLGKHDDEIHAATLRVKAWFRDWVTMDRSIEAWKPHTREDLPSLMREPYHVSPHSSAPTALSSKQVSHIVRGAHYNSGAR